MFIDIRKLGGHPNTSTLIEFTDPYPGEAQRKYTATVAHMESIGYKLWTMSRNEDDTHIQGLWLPEKDYAVYAERALESCRNSLSHIKINVVAPTEKDNQWISQNDLPKPSL